MAKKTNITFRANNTPFMDICNLISVEDSKDSDGYPIATETAREVFCSVCDGVVRSEFYEAYKAGITASATIELWQDDYFDAWPKGYNNDRLIEQDGVRYKVIRQYPTGYGTLECSCQEAVR